MKNILWIAGIFLMSMFSSGYDALAADGGDTPVRKQNQSSVLEESSVLGKSFEPGLKQYRAGNYEEAMPLFLQATKEAPSNAIVYYYLGLTYQGKLKFPEAEAALIKSVALDASQGNSFAHLGEIRYRLHQYDEARLALEEGMKKGARPAYTAYLMGLTLMELGDYPAAIESLQKAGAIQPAYKQKMMYALGMVYKKQKNKQAAEQAFREAIAMNPDTTAGVFASIGLQSLKSVEKRPFHIDFGYGFYYDDNVILKPAGVSPIRLPANEKDFVHVVSLHGEYTATFSGAFSLRADATMYERIHHRLSMMDVNGFGLALTPVVSGSIGSFAITGKAEYYMIGHHRYLTILSANPSFSFSMGRIHQGSIHVGYQNKQFLQTAFNAAENRDASNWSAGYTHRISSEDRNSYLTLDYNFDRNKALGNNWAYDAHRLSVSGLYWLHHDFGFRFNGYYYLQNYKNPHTRYLVARRDRVWSVAPVLTYDLHWVTLLLQYTYVKANSNIRTYAYSRNITGVGFEYHY